jgi:multidrug efflux system membrane fusion protein
MKHLACVVVPVAAAVAFLAACSKQEAPPDKRPGGMPAPVVLGTAERKSVPIEVGGFGMVEANMSVAVKAQVTGPVSTRHFTPGQAVKEGDLLYEIDPRPFHAALRQCMANKARNLALLENAGKAAARQAELRKKGFSSQEELDQANAALGALTAALQADDAAIEQAKIQLDYCSIRSPIAGRTGTVTVDPGNIVKANEAVLVTVLQVRPVKVRFTLAEQQVRPVAARLAAGKVAVSAAIPSDPGGPEPGELAAMDNAIDPGTGMVRLDASFPNASGRLWPGQFVNVTVSLGMQENAVIVPAPAVQTSQKGAFVFVFDPAATNVAMRPVKVERSTGSETVISGGLEAGEKVVTDGHLRLRPGMQVTVREPAKSNSGSRR